MSKIIDPCVKICQTDSNGLCYGCQRTIEERAKWSSYSNDERAEILKDLTKRSNVQGANSNLFLR
ncbi:MAG: DUF1289 domain-containing protein [Bacteroidales bacterium]|jgi:predicted Fe-S protein YdhL (DUF1289 family)|nr:DUF1289 domain-containing protein [Bacteroidales bacterium]